MKYLKFSLLLLLAICIGNCDKPNLSNELVTLDIQVQEEITNHTKVPMTLSEKTDGTTKVYQEGRIELRGGFSIQFPKHSYEIDLDDDRIIAGLPKDDDWILNANYIDKTFLRHIVSYELFREMNPNNIAAKCKFVEVELNSEYQGFYLLMEKLDKSIFNIDRDDTTAFIFKEPHLFRLNYDNVIPQNLNNFHQQTYPKITSSNKSYQIESIRNFISNTPNQQLKNSINMVLDIQNIIDWHLLLLLTNNDDGILKNFYLYKINANTPVRVAPWDYDHSFGRDGDNELNLGVRQIDLTVSILFNRLIEFDWYKGTGKK